MILFLAFGAIVAASVPLLLGLTSVAAAMGALGLVSQVVPSDQSAGSLVVLFGLAVGVDYSLFYIRREREERRAGKGPDAALDATAATVGRAVVVSGLTVMVALAGLLFTGLAVFTAMALGDDRRRRDRRRRLASPSCRPCSRSSATASTAAACRSWAASAHAARAPASGAGSPAPSRATRPAP